jgi:hypothetical protein
MTGEGAPMESELLTLKDIAIKLGLPESTLRKYRDAYDKYIPMVGTGRDRLHKQEAIEVFRAIRRYRAGELLSWEDTEKRIAARFPLETGAGEQAPHEEEQPPAPPPPSPEVMEALASLKTKVEQQNFMINTMGAELLRVAGILKSYEASLSHLAVMRRTILSQHNDFRALEKDRKTEQYQILDHLTQVRSSIMYIQRVIEKTTGTTAPALAPLPPPKLPPPPADADAEEQIAPRQETDQQPSVQTRRLAELLKERNDEVSRMKAANSKLLTEIDSLRARINEAPAAHHVPLAEPVQPSITPPASVFQSGKFVFKGKKK